jgi:hypothetical protein
MLPTLFARRRFKFESRRIAAALDPAHDGAGRTDSNFPPHVVMTLAKAIALHCRRAGSQGARAAQERKRARRLQQFQRWKAAVRCARVCPVGPAFPDKTTGGEPSENGSEGWSALTTETS